MIHIVIAHARIEPSGGRSRYHVLHPSNSAVLAYCDTREEAEAVCKEFDAAGAVLEQRVKSVSQFHRLLARMSVHRFEVHRESAALYSPPPQPVPEATWNDRQQRWEVDLTLEALVALGAREGRIRLLCVGEPAAPDDVSVLEICDME